VCNKRTIYACASLVFCICCMSTSGCNELGLTEKPAGRRLAPEEHSALDGVWNERLRPLDVGRDELLRTIMTYGLYEFGVDKLELTTTKLARGFAVRMEIVFDRVKPEQDEFTVTYQDEQGHPIRTERYSGAEVRRYPGWIQSVFEGENPEGAHKSKDRGSATR
jgi:hypothetical protein